MKTFTHRTDVVSRGHSIRGLNPQPEPPGRPILPPLLPLPRPLPIAPPLLPPSPCKPG